MRWDTYIFSKMGEGLGEEFGEVLTIKLKIYIIYLTPPNTYKYIFLLLNQSKTYKYLDGEGLTGCQLPIKNILYPCNGRRDSVLAVFS